MAARSSPPSTRPRTALEPAARPVSASYSYSSPVPSSSQQFHNPATHAHAPSHAHTRSNRESGEVISSLIFSLSPITNQSEQLLDKLLPPQEAQSQNPAAKAKRRAKTSYNPRSAPTGDAPPFLSPLVKEQIVVADKHRGELPTVDEGRPSIGSSPPKPPARQKPKLHPPPIPIPRRSMSLRSGIQAPPIMEHQPEVDPPSDDAGDRFGSVSVMPGRAASPSIDSAHSSSQRRPIIGKGPSRAKSTRHKIKELDAERKRRMSAKTVARPTNSKTQHSPSLSRSSIAIPRTSNVSGDRSASPAKPSLLRHLSSPSSQSSTALGPAGAVDPGEMYDGTEPSKGKRTATMSSVATGNLAVPHGASRSKTESPDEIRPHMSARSSSRTGGRSKSRLRAEISKAAAERDAAGTAQRIQELKARKEQRELSDAVALHELRNPPQSVTANAQPSGLATDHPDDAGGDELDPDLIALAISSDEPMEQENWPVKRTLTQEQLPPAKLVRGPTAEPRKSSQQARPYSNLGYYPRPSMDVDTYTVADSIDEEVDEYLSDPRLSQKIFHQDTGRCVSYSDVGDPDGFVIICCVGMGTSRYVTAFYDELAQTLGLRLITPERPGIGDSEPYLPGEVDTPLGWPDDIRLICQHLNISRFSLLAHSAGSIYALATALRMPANIRGRVHVLAPWIPPSQLMAIGQNEEPVPVAELPLIQRILRSIPEAWLEAATRVFNMSSITSSLGKSPYAKRRRNTMPDGEKRPNRGETPAPPRDDDDDEAVHSAPASPNGSEKRDASRSRSRPRGNLQRAASSAEVRSTHSEQAAYQQPPMLDFDLDTLTAEERAAEYERRLTGMIWQLATSNANPAVDLMVCLERKQEIGFRYEDITKPVVLHHGTKDTRVSVDNVIWLGENMRRCEVRILEGEGHGLMANARVMYNVLSEMSQDWRDWNAVVKGKRQEA